MKRRSLNRTKGLKRTTKRTRRRKPKWQIEDLPRQLFREAAAKQRVYHSPNCKSRTKAHAHHVVYQQHATAAGANAHDPRNAMRVCGSCHFQHHHRVDGFVIPVSDLPLEALKFAVDVLDLAALDYFRRYYRDADKDDRLAELIGRRLGKAA